MIVLTFISIDLALNFFQRCIKSSVDIIGSFLRTQYESLAVNRDLGYLPIQSTARRLDMREFHANFINLLEETFKFGRFLFNIITDVVGQSHIMYHGLNLLSHRASSIDLSTTKMVAVKHDPDYDVKVHVQLSIHKFPAHLQKATLRCRLQ